MVPLHIPSLVLIACLSSAINLLCNVFLIQVNHKNRTFSRLIHSHRIHLLALLGLFTERNDRFYHPLKCLLYHKPRKREKVNPFGRNILVETIIGSNPPPPPPHLRATGIAITFKRESAVPGSVRSRASECRKHYGRDCIAQYLQSEQSYHRNQGISPPSTE